MPTPTGPRDSDGDGSLDGDDCDADDPAIYPGAEERCDGLDGDCDGVVDEGLDARYFRDADGDGFGISEDTTCGAREGYAPARGDCDDDDPAFHPGAPDAGGDGLDQDCGGTQGADPHLGFAGSPYAAVQAALDAAPFSGVTVWVGPGTWATSAATFRGKAVRLMSTHLAAATTLTGDGSNPVLKLITAETAGAVIDGFTITQGAPGISISGSSPTVRGTVLTLNDAGYGKGGGASLIDAGATFSDCIFSGNKASQGAGAYLKNSSASTFSRCTFAANRGTESSAGQGAGLYLDTSSVALTDVVFSGNRSPATSSGGADCGSGIFVTASSPSLTRVDFIDNVANSSAGGLCAGSSNLTLVDVLFQGNRGGYGGAMHVAGGSVATLERVRFVENEGINGSAFYVFNSTATADDLVFEGNHASAYGAAIYLDGGTSTFTNLLVVGNRARYDAACVYALPNAVATFTNATFVGNLSDNGEGCIRSFDPTKVNLTLRNVLMAYNGPFNVGDYLSGATATRFKISYSALYSRFGEPYELAFTPDATNLFEPPRMLSEINGDFRSGDLRLAPGSPLIDRGDPALSDPDGSRSDIGYYGGPGADWSVYADVDADGLYDSWELAHGLDPSVDDSASDTDGDGLTAAEELANRSDPQAPDSDLDGASDAEERDAETDPNDPWFSPAWDGPREVRIPADYPTIQAAIDDLPWEGVILVDPGSWTQALAFEHKGITLRSTAGAQDTVLRGDGGRVIDARSSRLDMDGFTVTAGAAPGLATTVYEGGGGLYLVGVVGTLEHLLVTGNTAAALGGGIMMFYSDPTLRESIVSANTSTKSGGAGLAVWKSTPWLTQVVIEGNAATNGNGGAIYGAGAQLDLDHVLIRGNTASKQGGAAYLGGTSIADLAWVRVEGNTGTDVISGSYTAFTIQQSAIVGNSGVGLNLSSGSSLTLRGSVIAYSTGGYNLQLNTGSSPIPTASVSYSALYNPSGPNHNVGSLPASDLTVEPKFLTYSQSTPSDVHLALDSPLINAADPSSADADGSRADIGAYGGPGGAEWDLDADGYPTWFWPGALTSAPVGFDPYAYDCDDRDAGSWLCP